MSRHTTVVDLLDGYDDADEHDIDLLVDLLGLARSRHAGHVRPPAGRARHPCARRPPPTVGAGAMHTVQRVGDLDVIVKPSPVAMVWNEPGRPP